MAASSAKTNDEKGTRIANSKSTEGIHEAFERGERPYSDRMSRRACEGHKAKLQAELLKVQIWAQETGQKFVLLFEGRGAAG